MGGNTQDGFLFTHSKQTNYTGGGARGPIFVLCESLIKVLDAFPEKKLHVNKKVMYLFWEFMDPLNSFTYLPFRVYETLINACV